VNQYAADIHGCLEYAEELEAYDILYGLVDDAVKRIYLLLDDVAHHPDAYTRAAMQMILKEHLPSEADAQSWCRHQILEQPSMGEGSDEECSP
jgi:hypothetical protein